MNGKSRTFRKIFIPVCLLIVGTFFGIFFYRDAVFKRQARYRISCANHFTQHYLPLLIASDSDPGLMLPSTDDTRAALAAVCADFHGSAGWLEEYGSACPESFLRDGSIGYVYIGDGLRLRDVIEHEILIFFCPSENHDGASRSYAGVSNNPKGEMIAILEEAIARGESGEIAYSDRAMNVLRSELNKRRFSGE